MVIDEPDSAEGRQTREMYAHYGLAMYFAQGLEASMKTALTMSQLSADDLATVEDFDATWANNATVTMGKLIRRLESHLGNDSSLGDDLALALTMRNQLAHHFFWDHAAEAMTTVGRQRMIEKCDAAIDLFQEVDHRLESMSVRLAEARGLTRAEFLSGTAEAAADLLSKVPGEGTRNCARCLVPMRVTGSDARPFWTCPECGSASLV